MATIAISIPVLNRVVMLRTSQTDAQYDRVTDVIVDYINIDLA